MSTPCIVVTRALPDGERTAAALRAKGHSVLVAPLLRIEMLNADLAGTWSAIIITSANAIRAIAAHRQRAALLGLPLFTVGHHSAAAAREAGFAAVASADGDAGDLVRLLAAQAGKFVQPVLYLAGEDRAVDVTGALAAAGIAVTTAMVYRAARLPMPAALVAALQSGAVGAVLHYSRRSAESYLAGARTTTLLERAISPRQICLSAHAAEPLSAAGAKNIAIAARPDEAALFELV